jgi:hypothetical protein
MTYWVRTHDGQRMNHPSSARNVVRGFLEDLWPDEDGERPERAVGVDLVEWPDFPQNSNFRSCREDGPTVE